MTLIIHKYARPKLRVRPVVGPGASTVIAGAGRPAGLRAAATGTAA